MARTPSAERSLAGLRILVVDDDMMVSMLVEDMLIELGCTVVGPAARVGQAIDLAATEAIDAALLDLNIAGQEVYPVASRLAGRGIPFAFVTGYGASQVSAVYCDRPTLQKPFREAQLAQVLRAISARGRADQNSE